MILNFFQKINRDIKMKSYRFSIFEISLFGLLLALYMIAAVAEKYIFVGAFRISITYALFVIFGLALGPWRGAFLGILSDTLNQVIFGVSTWMIEYAIIPVAIAFLSGFIFVILTKKDKFTWIFGLLFLSILTVIFVSVMATQYDSLPIGETSIKRSKKFTTAAILAIGSIGILLMWISSVTFLCLYLKTRNVKTKFSTQLLFSILLTVFVILILTRWLWGPFAYINYYNRFRGGNWTYSQYYFFFMIPIIFKSLIEIPIYTLIIFAIYPVIVLIRQKVAFASKKESAY
ncbi:ECF transporter S component [Mycoplasma enhydrae]|uniref:ECF transporter S component n=1 Tax=Mycoplasma enhydrae TaxID=2499220 RepID=UPI0021E791E1|nr:ECF transporter S component [Mycoplasma enhydrae]MCV3753597.1 ECF transporter S component [Mycoplasma enhydrae]